MPTTRKKVIKTVYKDDDDSEGDAGDFSDSGSDAVISQPSSSEDDEEPVVHESSEDTKKNKSSKSKPSKKPKFTKSFIDKVNRQPISTRKSDDCDPDAKEPIFSVKDLTEADKLLPSFLNLSESDSSDDEESPKVPSKLLVTQTNTNLDIEMNEVETYAEYKDVWSSNLEQSEEIAKKTFLELQKHKSRLEETKQSIQKYTVKNENTRESDVNDLLALGEEVLPPVVSPKVKKRRGGKTKNDSDSEMEDWEEVAEGKTVPQQGLQLIVDFPGAVSKKSKKLDVEMMMKRKINRVKKEYQVYMHKVHVLCWIGHGNYVSQVLNNQDVMKAALSMVPSKTCYPEERVDMKYVEQITTWFKDKLTIKLDKNEGKFRPKAPPLKEILLQQINSKVVTSKKYFVFIFVSMLRALGLQCRIMLNFTTLPIKPPSTELCSLSTKPKTNESGKEDKKIKECKKKTVEKITVSKNIPQLDGNYDPLNDTDLDNITQLDGNDDSPTLKENKPLIKGKSKAENNNVQDVSPPKRPRRNLSIKKDSLGLRINLETDNKNKDISQSNENVEVKSEPVVRKVTRKSLSLNKKISSPKNIDNSNANKTEMGELNIDITSGSSIQKVTRKTLSLNRNISKPKNNNNTNDIKTEEGKVTRDATSGGTTQKITGKSLLLNRNTSNPKNDNNTNEKKTDQGEVKKDVTSGTVQKVTRKSLSLNKKLSKATMQVDNINDDIVEEITMRNAANKTVSLHKKKHSKKDGTSHVVTIENKTQPKIIVTDNDTGANISSEYFNLGESSVSKREVRTRKRSHTSNPLKTLYSKTNDEESKKPRAKSVPAKTAVNKSKYFKDNKTDENVNVAKTATSPSRQVKANKSEEKNSQRVSHRDLLKAKTKATNDVTNELVNIIKKRVREAKTQNKKGRTNKSSDEDSDYLSEISDSQEQKASTSRKSNAKSGKSRKIDRRVLSTDDEAPSKKIDTWCEIFVEELEQWVAVDVIKGRVHCVNEIYSGATHPVNYVVGWDNNNYLKDLTRRYVPHWNTVTRKQRVELSWWDKAIQPWVGPRTPRDREEDECLDRLQLDAPLPKSIAEYKNHPLYALKRHLLKFEAIYPPDAATLGFVRGEPVYARECVYICRSRDTWLKEAKVVKLGEKPYKVVKARPKWDRLSNKLITDKPLEIFGPWQVQDYEPPVAENGIVPRNAYGNVELFKDCMLPKGTAHIKLPGLHRIAKKLNIDCAPAMTGFDFNGGWSHPVFDGFVVCKEFEDIIISAWEEDQEELERKEQEKTEARVYGNWRRLIKGLLIKERLKLKYGFTEPSTSQDSKKKSTGPRLTVKKKL